jgi:hypothetical protein
MKVRSMKKFVFIIGIILSIGIISNFLVVGYNSYARSGCCKQRRSIGGEWYVIDLNRGECEALNRRKDGDNLDEPIGFVWWDRDC